jgi:hypothetical protein
MLFFDNTITSRAKSDHVRLKRVLHYSYTDDLKKMIHVIELLLKNQRSEYLIVEKEAKTRVS